MAILSRTDGKQFSTECYRELLAPKSATIFKNQLRLLAQTNGQFVRLFRQERGWYEAVFSRDQGYLLGEHIWHALGKPKQLIYCEAMPNGHYLLVIVQNGLVQLDALLTLNEVEAELAALAQNPMSYVVKIAHGVPIGTSEKSDCELVLSDACVESFEYIEPAYFETLQLQERLRLVPVEQALNAVELGAAQVWLWTCAILVAAALCFWMWSQSQPKPIVRLLSPLELYQAQLRAPEIKSQIRVLQSALELGSSVPGWEITKVDYGHSIVELELHSYGGTVEDLLNFTKSHQFDLELSSRGAIVRLKPKISDRKPPEGALPTLTILGKIIDNMQEVMPNQAIVSVNETRTIAGFHETSTTINLNQTTLAELGIIREQLAGLPIKLQDAHINVNNGLLSGMIRVLVIGS